MVLSNLYFCSFNFKEVTNIRLDGDFFLCLKPLFHLKLYNNFSSFIREIKVILIWFFGILTIIGYLMPNPLYTYK